MKRKKYLFIIVVCLIGAILPVGKSLLIPGCMPFDVLDDANHTFVNLFVAQQSMKAGAVPLINLYNNFGTPFLGDALTYPFAVQSLTYWLLPYDIALGVNRFVLAFLTVFVLISYFRRKFSLFTSGVCSLVVMYTPGFIWHFAHHHYQASLLFFVLILFLQEKFHDRGGRKFFVLMWVAFVLLFLSVSIQLALLMLPFIFLNQVFIARGKIDKAMLLLLLAAGAGMAFYYTDILFMLRSAARCARIHENYFGFHVRTAIYYPAAVTALSFFGASYLFYRINDRWEAWRVVLLGIIPIYAVIILTFNAAIWHAIPVLRSVDILRFWWCSSLFLMLGAGYALEFLRQRFIQYRMICVLFFVLAVMDGYFIAQMSSDENFDMVIKQLFFVFPCVLLLIFTGFNYFHKRVNLLGPKAQPGFLYFLGVVLALLQLVYSGVNVLHYNDLFVCRKGHYFSPKNMDRFFYPELVKKMQKGSRVAVELSSNIGLDLKLIRDGMMGSAGRSVFMPEKFGQHLLNEKLIIRDGIPFAYHFSRPWDSRKLARLGIRYVVQLGPMKDAFEKGWKLIATEGNWSLFENLRPVSLAYLWFPDEKRYPIPDSDIHIMGNTIQVVLPQIKIPIPLVVAFHALPEWQAKVDGRIRPVSRNKDFMLEVLIHPGDRQCQLVFAPFGAWHLIAGVGVSLILLISGIWILKIKKCEEPGGE